MPSTANTPRLSRLWKTITREAGLVLNATRASAHQLSHATRLDRYPELFTELAAACDQPPGRILSFGCSSGEECVSLRQYFPAATIIGADVSPAILEEARGKWKGEPGIQFCPSDQTSLNRHGPFDIICCLSVLCRHRATRRRRDCGRVYPFEQFQTQCGELSTLLRPGGLLAIYNSNFRFTDTAIADQFETLPHPTLTESGFVVKFDHANQRLAAQDYPHCIFRKL